MYLGHTPRLVVFAPRRPLSDIRARSHASTDTDTWMRRGGQRSPE